MSFTCKLIIIIIAAFLIVVFLGLVVDDFTPRKKRTAWLSCPSTTYSMHTLRKTKSGWEGTTTRGNKVIAPNTCSAEWEK